jgi:flagellin
MAMVINTNIGSESAVRLLDKSSRSQATTMERLTSGQSINHSKDNAAGQTIVIGMDSQVRGTNQAVRNANDAMALIQTADGAADEVIGILQRQRELSIQALNGTYNQENRSQMNTEFKQLSTEINRIAGTTKFNELPVMAQIDTTITSTGKFLSTAASTRIMQVGWEVGNGGSGRDKIQVSMGNFWIGSGAIGTAATDIFGAYVNTKSDGTKTTIVSAYANAKISTVSAASTTVMRIDSALSNIGTLRAKWGAIQNRLEHTTSNLNNVNENIMAARSRIQDTDYARESANLARTQVLQQAGMSMLTQANQSGQSVMSLLK